MKRGKNKKTKRYGHTGRVGGRVCEAFVIFLWGWGEPGWDWVRVDVNGEVTFL